MAKETKVELPDQIEVAPFVPVAYYDKHLDCLRVMTMDRSVTEERVDGFITLYRCNHRGPFDPPYVGFTLKGVGHLFDQVGLDIGGVYRLADIIDRLVKYRLGSAMSNLLKIVYRDFETNGDLRVDLSA